MSSESPSKRTSDLFSVWPTDLGKEWRARTRFGKLQFLLLFPAYVFGWASILVLVAAAAVCFYLLKAIWRVSLFADRKLPNTYKGENNG